MKHLLVSYHTCPLEEPGTGLAGGMNVFLRGLLHGLAGRGIDTDVLTRGRGDVVETTHPYPGVRVIHVPCGWEKPDSREGAFRALPRFVEKAKEVVRTRVGLPDAVSAHYWMSGMAARGVLRREHSAGMVFAFHTVEARKVEAAGYIPDALSAARRGAEERLAREARRLVFLSGHDLAETERVLPGVAGKGVVIPPGVDGSFRDPPSREDGRRAFHVSPAAFLFVLASRPAPGKNVPVAIDAFLAMREHGDREAWLLVAGLSPPAGGGPAGVRFAGPVPHARMPALLAAADAVLCPSGYESFGLVPLEAMAAGVPVIVPRDGYWGGTVRREGGGAVYPAENSRGLAGAMAKIMADGAARTRMEEEGRRIASRFTWGKCTESWERLLSSVATPDSRR